MQVLKMFLLLGCCVAFAASASDRALESVEQSVEQLRLAMISADPKILKSLTSDKLSYGHSGGHIENQAEFIEKITSGKSAFISAEFKNQTISLVGDAAIVRHLLSAHVRDNGVEKDIAIGIIMVWQKHKGLWKLIARQGYKLPT